LARLGDRASLPVFLVRYADDFSWWEVSALNDLARPFLPDRRLSEREYVALLYRLRAVP